MVMDVDVVDGATEGSADGGSRGNSSSRGRCCEGVGGAEEAVSGNRRKGEVEVEEEV